MERSAEPQQFRKIDVIRTIAGFAILSAEVGFILTHGANAVHTTDRIAAGVAILGGSQAVFPLNRMVSGQFPWNGNNKTTA